VLCTRKNARNVRISLTPNTPVTSSAMANAGSALDVMTSLGVGLRGLGLNLIPRTHLGCMDWMPDGV